MDNIKDDNYYLQKMAKDLDFILEHTKMLSQDEFESNAVLLDSVMFRLIQISENSTRLTEELRNAHKDIPWFAIRGLRNRIVHNYGEVDMKIVYDTVSKDIPDVYQKIIKLV